MTVLVLDDPGSLGTAWESEGCSSAGLGGLGLKIRDANHFSHVEHDPHVTMALSKLVLAKGIPTNSSFHVILLPSFLYLAVWKPLCAGREGVWSCALLACG